MSRKYPRPIPHYRPISQKAYDTFVRQIFAVVPKDNRCADMVEALDKYLNGDRDTYASHLDEHTAITFEMLRFEIDKAIERSARARRPRRRKIEAEVSFAKADCIVETPSIEKSVNPTAETVAKPVISVAETIVMPASKDFILNTDLFPTQTHVSPVGLMSDFVSEQLSTEQTRHQLPRRLRRAIDRAMQYARI